MVGLWLNMERIVRIKIGGSMTQTYTDRIFHYLAYVLGQPMKCKGCGGNGFIGKWRDNCKECKGACMIPTPNIVHLDALTKDQNRPQFITAVKRFIDEHPEGNNVEFNNDYTKIRKI